jgi:hypothetical protein
MQSEINKPPEGLLLQKAYEQLYLVPLPVTTASTVSTLKTCVLWASYPHMGPAATLCAT